MISRLSLKSLLSGSPYQSYVYSYPHKTAYRPLDPPIMLSDAWASEDRSALFLYMHVPFCEQRCGFCNLFTQSQPATSIVGDYLNTLERQADIIAETVKPQAFARMAIGGGTPTFLDANQLERLFQIAKRLGAHAIPCSIEASPSTVTPDRIAVLVRHKIQRVSIGVQSTRSSETTTLRRHQNCQTVQSTLGQLRDAKFPTVNADLMYGQNGQTEISFIESIEDVINWGANELYLYPLYIRPLTTLGKLGAHPKNDQANLYRAGRDHLIKLGWKQLSMRLFRSPATEEIAGPTYQCQNDGMIGIGPGARSYTKTLHYASGYAISQSGVRDHIATWNAQSDSDLSLIRHGIKLDDEDQRRRYVLLSILENGLSEAAYFSQFGTHLCEDLPQLEEGIDEDVLQNDNGYWRLTDKGISFADVIGRWLYSPRVEQLMQSWSPA